jgi:hypothetical protein
MRVFQTTKRLALFASWWFCRDSEDSLGRRRITTAIQETGLLVFLRRLFMRNCSDRLGRRNIDILLADIFGDEGPADNPFARFRLLSSLSHNNDLDHLSGSQF